MSFLVATVPISIAGSAAMRREPLWKPNQYVPVVGMILGNGRSPVPLPQLDKREADQNTCFPLCPAISAVTVSLTSVLKEFTENRDKVETYLAMGASRYEACRPIARDALKLALLPTINQMSVIGLISIPGLMTGAILGGDSVEQAAKLQSTFSLLSSLSNAGRFVTERRGGS
jgi:ABC-type iron transport system FetAB permease component